MADLKRVSKYFSYLLRHKPDSIGLELDEQGWALIDDLIAKTTDFELSRELLDIVVETNDKQRFAVSTDGSMIRANQGHSIEVDLALENLNPPAELFHGTAQRFLQSIEKEGLNKQKRHHVHLTESVAVARAVGARYGKVVLLRIDSKKMKEKGFKFYRTANNVWLVEHIPYEFISKT